LKANIYATWHRITPEKIYQFTTEAHRMAFQHTDVATDIKQQFYMNASQRNYGIIFTLEGKVATPLQIALTDSNRYFFNASLYFDQTSYHDSLKYIVDYLRIDLLKIMDTFELQSSPKK
jgi:gliding motility-associated lipoprotein GldD